MVTRIEFHQNVEVHECVQLDAREVTPEPIDEADREECEINPAVVEYKADEQSPPF